MQNEQDIKKGTILKHNRQGFTVIFNCMVNAKEFRTMNGLQLMLNEFTVVGYQQDEFDFSVTA